MCLVLVVQIAVLVCCASPRLVRKFLPILAKSDLRYNHSHVTGTCQSSARTQLTSCYGDDGGVRKYVCRDCSAGESR